MMVTGQLTIDADVLGRVYLRLGTAARSFCPDAHAWFIDACQRLDVRVGDVALQWNALAMITAVTGVAADEVGDHHFELGSTAIVGAYVTRGLPASGRNMASIFHRLRLTLFHAGRLDSHRRPRRHPPVSVAGWAVVAPAFADNARRYVAQVELSLRPNTTKHIESDLREFGTWIAEAHPDVASCAELERRHIEDYKVGIDAEREARHVVDGETVDEQGPRSHLLEAKGGTQERITLWAAPVLPVDPARSVQASPERKPHGDAGVKQRLHRRHGEVTDERQRLHQDEVGSIVFEHPGYAARPCWRSGLVTSSEMANATAACEASDSATACCASRMPSLAALIQWVAPARALPADSSSSGALRIDHVSVEITSHPASR